MIAFVTLLQAGSAEFTLSEGLRQGGLALAVLLLVIAVLALWKAYREKDKEAKDAVAGADDKKEAALEKQQKHYVEILKEKDKLVADAAKKFEDLSEKFREKTTDLVLSNQRYTMEVNTELKNLSHTLKSQLNTLTTAINNAVSVDGR